MEIHALGNQNYFTVELTYPKMPSSGKLDLYLDADYINAPRDISLSEGVLVHGEGKVPRQALENFRDYVFSVGETVSNNDDVVLSHSFTFDAFPNPNVNRLINYELSAETTLNNAQLEVIDLTGRMMATRRLIDHKGSVRLSDLGAGLYYLRVLNNGKIKAVRSISIR